MKTHAEDSANPDTDDQERSELNKKVQQLKEEIALLEVEIDSQYKS